MNTLLTLFNLERYKAHTRDGFWRDDTVYALARGHAERTPDRVAVRTAFGVLTYADLIRAVDAFATDLTMRGVRPGQRIAVWLPSRAETVVALLACSRGGFVCCPSLHRDHTVADIVSLLRRMRATALVVERGYGADADSHDIIAASKDVETLDHVYALDKPVFGHGIVADAAASAEMPTSARDPNHVLYLAFTSGTTGVPKGVMHSDNTLLANARALSADWAIDPSSVVYSLSPLSHNLGFGAMIMAFAAGAELVLHDLPRKHSLVDRIVATGTTFLVGVPTHAIDILNEVRERKMTGLGALTGFRISGAAAPGDVVAELLRYGIKPQSGYGMTETCSHQYTLPDDDPKLIVETCGKSCPGYEIRIFDRAEPDRPLPVGEVGQIGGRGASLMLGYFDDQQSTEESFNADGWFMTGDLGWVDAQGYLRITGRKKDVIIRGGHNIYPARIEALASGCDAIRYALAVPVADKRLGEKVCLAVMFQPGRHATAEEILKFLHTAGLSKYDMPEYFMEIDDIPLTASGKIRKRDVTDGIAAGRVHPTPVRWQPDVPTEAS
ncbi:MAG TPA: class I adenylate-forming enzyme family protein [Xanthobacteraceae bacterium]|jgi:acyl-CoA synthetase (AMP-forming)/AMP-acid ligase II|nr:class I adenylate-forming enzyme family protein [Xanthobacteraceae bacterium]